MVIASPKKREIESHHWPVTVLLTAALLAAGGTPSLAAVVSFPADLSSSPGQVVVAPMSIDTMDGIIGIVIDVAYDPAALEATAVSKTTLTQSFTLNHNIECVGQPPRSVPTHRPDLRLPIRDRSRHRRRACNHDHVQGAESGLLHPRHHEGAPQRGRNILRARRGECVRLRHGRW